MGTGLNCAWLRPPLRPGLQFGDAAGRQIVLPGSGRSPLYTR